MKNQITEPTLSKTQQKKLRAQEHNAKLDLTESNRSPTKEERVELEALSLEVFNSASRYLTLMTKGEVVPVMVTVTELIPAVQDADGKEVTPEQTKEVQVAETIGNTKSNKLQVVYHTVESVRALMVERKRQLDGMRALMAKMEADKKAEAEKAKLQQTVQNELGGSAV
jgi:hypothetical protein